MPLLVFPLPVHDADARRKSFASGAEYVSFMLVDARSSCCFVRALSVRKDVWGRPPFQNTACGCPWCPFAPELLMVSEASSRLSWLS